MVWHENLFGAICPYFLASGIAANNLSILKRKPSDLLRYIEWTNDGKATYGVITNFVLQERLHWQPLSGCNPDNGPVFTCEGDVPFSHTADWKILRNDWPYGITPGISHLIVWSKIRLEDEKPEGFLTPESIKLVEAFVRETFVHPLLKDASLVDAKDRVLWFRNWTGLQSVRGLEHVHVLLRDVPTHMLDMWTRRGGYER